MRSSDGPVRAGADGQWIPDTMRVAAGQADLSGTAAARWVSGIGWKPFPIGDLSPSAHGNSLSKTLDYSPLGLVAFILIK